MQRIKIRVKSLATARGFEYHLRRCGIRQYSTSRCLMMTAIP